MPPQNRTVVPRHAKIQHALKHATSRTTSAWELSSDEEDHRLAPVHTVAFGRSRATLGFTLDPNGKPAARKTRDKTAMYRYVQKKRVHYEPGDDIHMYSGFSHSDLPKMPKYELKRLAHNIKILLHLKYNKQKDALKAIESSFGSKKCFVTLAKLDKNLARIRDRIFAIRKGADGYENATYTEIRAARKEMLNPEDGEKVQRWKTFVLETLRELDAADLAEAFTSHRSEFTYALGVMHWLSHAKKYVFRAMEHYVQHMRAHGDEKVEIAQTIGNVVKAFRADLVAIYKVLQPRSDVPTQSGERKRSRPRRTPTSGG